MFPSLCHWTEGDDTFQKFLAEVFKGLNHWLYLTVIDTDKKTEVQTSLFIKWYLHVAFSIYSGCSFVKSLSAYFLFLPNDYHNTPTLLLGQRHIKVDKLRLQLCVTSGYKSGLHEKSKVSKIYFDFAHLEVVWSNRLIVQ